MEKPVICRKRHHYRPRLPLTAWASAVALLGLALAPLPGVAGSNLEQDYPAHRCGNKPVPPDRPEKFRNRADLDAYNEKVHAFNAAMEQYVNCVQRYVDNAASDIRAIREKLDAALEAVKP